MAKNKNIALVFRLFLAHFLLFKKRHKVPESKANLSLSKASLSILPMISMICQLAKKYPNSLSPKII
jgi:hypothetical protein